jgi:hypothetical protein
VWSKPNSPAPGGLIRPGAAAEFPAAAVGTTEFDAMRKSILLPDVNTGVDGSHQSAAGTSRAPKLTRLSRRWGALCGAAALLGWLSGCQCCCCGTNAYSAVIDCINDHPLRLECLYCSKLDLTRINRPGGIQCGRCCCRPQQCCSGGIYAHRWNSPPAPPMTAAPSGLEGAPTYPADEAGPYFPPTDVAPPSEDGSAVPLFTQPMEPSTRQATPMPAAEPQAAPPAADPEVMQMNYRRIVPDLPRLQVPVEAIFAP